jgi:hypothetical protein
MSPRVPSAVANLGTRVRGRSPAARQTRSRSQRQPASIAEGVRLCPFRRDEARRVTPSLVYAAGPDQDAGAGTARACHLLFVPPGPHREAEEDDCCDQLVDRWTQSFPRARARPQRTRRVSRRRPLCQRPPARRSPSRNLRTFRGETATAQPATAAPRYSQQALSVGF